MRQLGMHCNLRPPDAAPVLTCFNYNALTPMPRFKSDNLSVPVFIALLLLIRYTTLWGQARSQSYACGRYPSLGGQRLPALNVLQRGLFCLQSADSQWPWTSSMSAADDSSVSVTTASCASVAVPRSLSRRRRREIAVRCLQGLCGTPKDSDGFGFQDRRVMCRRLSSSLYTTQHTAAAAHTSAILPWERQGFF